MARPPEKMTISLNMQRITVTHALRRRVIGGVYLTEVSISDDCIIVEIDGGFYLTQANEIAKEVRKAYNESLT